MAVAVVFVLSAGEIDLSLGSVVALSALVTADVMQSHSAVLAVAAGLGVGLGIGVVNGLIVTLLRLPSFLVTLASLGIVAGLARRITNLESVAVENQRFINIFGSGDVGPIPSLAFWALGAVALGQFVFRHRRFGAHVVATGDNVGAARVAGIRVDRVKFAVLVLSAGSAAVAGILYTGRLQGASYTLGEQDLLTVIAAVVIGGTRLFGGEGSVIGALVGSLIMGMLTNGMILWGLSSSEQMIAQGILLLLAISLTLRGPKERVAVTTPLIRIERVRKEFGAVVALEEVTLDVDAGDIVALVGDNGAGKSTVVKCIAGVYPPTSGQIVLEGRPVHFSSPLDARSQGIEAVFQDLALANLQPVYMNMFLGRELVTGPLRRLDREAMAAETQALLDELDVRIDSPQQMIRDLSGGQRQGVAIARAVRWAQRLVLLDEPTAALGVAETRRVEELIRRMRDRGRAIVIVSHSLDQVFRLADRICVLRRGKQVGIRRTSDTTSEEIIAMITGLR